MTFKFGMTVDLCMAYLLILVCMSWTLMHGHSLSSKANIQCWIISSTKQATSMFACYDGRTFFFTWPSLWKRLYGLAFLLFLCRSLSSFFLCSFLLLLLFPQWCTFCGYINYPPPPPHHGRSPGLSKVPSFLAWSWSIIKLFMLRLLTRIFTVLYLISAFLVHSTSVFPNRSERNQVKYVMDKELEYCLWL